VPVLSPMAAVSPDVTITRSTGTPRRAAQTCANVVAWLCPFEGEPTVTRTSPSAPTSTRADSLANPVAVVDERGAVLLCLCGVEHGRQRLVCHGDSSRGVGGAVGVGGDDEGDGRAIVADDVGGQRRFGARRDIRPLHRAHDGVAERGQVARAEHGDDAGHATRFREIEACDTGVGVGAAHEGGVQHARQADVVGVARLPLDHGGIFAAAQALADG